MRKGKIERPRGCKEAIIRVAGSLCTAGREKPSAACCCVGGLVRYSAWHVFGVFGYAVGACGG